MNKLLQTTLISAILSTGVMAAGPTGALPKTIESGATVYVNKDISIGDGDDMGFHTVIDNYGSIDTEVTEAPFPKIMGANEREQTTINNHVGRSIKEETDETTATTIKTANPVTNVTLDKVYKIVDEGGGYVNENLQKENVEIVEVYDGEIGTTDLKSYTSNDILYLGNETTDIRTVKIVNTESERVMPDININLGNQSDETPYVLKLIGEMDITGDLSNYKNGSITIKHGEDDGQMRGVWFSKSKGEIWSPITIDSSRGANFQNGTIIHKSIDVKTGSCISFDGDTVLKSGAVLRIGDKPASSGTGE